MKEDRTASLLQGLGGTGQLAALADWLELCVQCDLHAVS